MKLASHTHKKIDTVCSHLYEVLRIVIFTDTGRMVEGKRLGKGRGGVVV